ncbi:Origin recognition complex, subunit 1 [Mortierella alpina]|nr:Origin recognition complex, subunit 1 [Mortierella alpina]
MAAASRKANKRLQSAKSQAARRDTLFPASNFEAEEELVWIGEPLNKDSFIQRKSLSSAGEELGSTTGLGSTTSRRATRGSGLSNIPFYRGFRKGKETYMVGDTVLLRNEHYSRKFECPHVAQILSLWETEEGDCLGDFRWFHQADDIAKLRRHQRTGNYPERLETGEIVYTLDDDENEISTVVAKCRVLDEAEWRRRFGESEAVIDADERDRMWFSRGVVRKLSGYHAVSWKGNEEMLKLREDKDARPKIQTTQSASAHRHGSKTHDGKRKASKMQHSTSDHTSEESASDYNQEDNSDDDADQETPNASVTRTKAKSSSVISPFQFVEINGMKVTEPSYAYVLLWLALSDQKVTANHALQLLEKQFSTPGPRRLPCVVLMDELDLLVTSKQTVMYNFFEWPNWLHSRLIVVAVANTMDLPERMLSNKVSSRLGLTRINFQPYTYQQLVKIVESRMAGINAFRREAIEFAARKVGAVSGDARRALDICRRAVEIVESSAQKIEDQRRKATNDNPLDDPGLPQEQLQVTIRIVDQAIKEMFASPNVRLIQTASLHQKLFLVALTAKLRRLGLAEAEFSEVAHAHLQMCRLHNIEPPMLSDLSAICASLGSSRCLLVESGKQDIHQRVRLSVSEEDVIMALKADPLFKRLLDTLPSAPAS